MPKRSSSSPPRPSGLAAWLPSRGALLWVPGAFVAGLLLFAVVWLTKSEDSPVAPTAPSAAGERDQDASTLPAPLPARNGERRVERPAPAADAGGPPPAQLVEAPPPAPPPDPLEQAGPLPSTATDTAGASLSPQPIPGQTPSPRYPARALRRRESGTVLVRAEISPEGVPVAVSVERSSGSRALDRAAENAVQRWRFRPAQRDGQPIAGSVIVPISFDPQ